MVSLQLLRRAGSLLGALLTGWWLALAPLATRAADDGFLDPAQAFQLSARVLSGHRIELSYRIAPGYYLYRGRFKFSADAATLDAPQIPAGQKHFDNALGEQVETYHDQVVVVIPVRQAPARFTLNATHQGCAEKGLCYPPQPRALQVSLADFGASSDAVEIIGDAAGGPANPTGAGSRPTASMSTAARNGPASLALRDRLLGLPVGGAPIAAGGGPSPMGGTPGPATASAGAGTAVAAQAAPPAPAVTSEPPAPGAAGGPGAGAPPDDAATAVPLGDDRRMTAALMSGHVLTIVSLAFVLGLGLALTPCVWPMLPILSSIIVGQGKKVSPARGLSLAATYSLGMATVYTALGVVAGRIGESFTGYLQSPPVLVAFAVLLVLLSLSMFGLYELQLPSAWRDRLQARHETLTGGQLGGVFGMGVLSALVVSPCVSAPLVGVLLYIGQAHDAVLGGLALFMIAAGMSVPLLVIGASAGRALPHSGAWMEQVKRVFGLLLLAVALYLVQPVIPAVAAMVVWGVLAIVTASTLGAFEPVTTPHHAGTARTVKGLGLVLAVLGVFELVGAVSGGRDPAAPLAHLAARSTTGGAVAAGTTEFRRVTSIPELERTLSAAGRPVMLDVYADWCVACKELEKETLSDPAIRQRLAGALLLRMDVTTNSEADRALLRRFSLFGPPGLIFFDPSGREIDRARVVGFQDSERFGHSLAAAGL